MILSGGLLGKVSGGWELILDSSAVEHPAVNRRVVGSNPTRGVNFVTTVIKGYSSVGRTLVSKTKCREFESFCPC